MPFREYRGIEGIRQRTERTGAGRDRDNSYSQSLQDDGRGVRTARTPAHGGRAAGDMAVAASAFREPRRLHGNSARRGAIDKAWRGATNLELAAGDANESASAAYNLC